jgi:PAS domain-containing protein
MASAALVCLFCLLTSAFSSGLRNSFRLGADYTNQTYKTWHSDTVQEDTADVETEARASWQLLLDPGSETGTRVSGNNSLTISTGRLSDDLGLELESDLTERLALEAGLDAEARHYHRLLPAMSDTTWRRDYMSGSTRLGLGLKLSEASELKVSDRAELEHYPEPDSYSYDCLVNRAEARFSTSIGLFGSFDADLSWARRWAWQTDSQDYNDYGLRLGYDNYAGDWQFRLDNDVSRRAYESPRRSYWEVEPDAGIRWQASPAIGFALSDNPTYTRHDAPDEVYSNGWTNRLVLGLEWQVWAPLGLKFGPEFERSASLPEGQPEDYRDRSLRLGLDLMFPGRLWLSVEDRLGSRTYRSADSSYQSNYRYNELTAMLDWTIVGPLSLNAMATVAPEWHAEQTDNLSAATSTLELRYGF